MATKWIPLPPGTTIEDVGDKQGGQETTVVVSAGPDRGTYKTSSANLADDATEAKELAGPDTDIKIEVDTATNEILKISTKKTI